MSTQFDRSGGRELFGLAIILVGFALLMNAMNILPFGPIVSRVWLPVILICIGLFQMSRARRNEGRIGGAFFVMFGSLLLLSKLNVWDLSFGRLIGPAILMWIGVSMLVGRSRPRLKDRPARMGMDQTVDSSDYIEATAILGGFHRKCSSQQFRGGDVTAIMGGGKLDLREAQMQADEAVIDVFTIMGGMEIQVPPNWTVEQGFVPILGGYDDKTRKTGSNGKRLLLHGTTIMGGISVTN